MSQTIFITGASSGLGKETAKLFQARGWNVVATMRDVEGDGGKELGGLENVLVTRLDVLDKASIGAAVEAGLARFGRIDVLVNNAGYGAYGPLEAFSDEQIERQFGTNVLGLLQVTRALLPHFRANKGGAIVNISSIGGRITFPLGSLYHGTKFAIEGISESLRSEVAEFGGRVKVVEPGAIATDFAGRSLDFANDASLGEYQELIGKLMAATPSFYANASSPAAIAEVVFVAATDGSDRLRYAAGADAEALIGTGSEETNRIFNL